MRLVITGNMGCGKSAVTKVFATALPNHKLFDFDKEVSELYNQDHIQTSLTKEFGTCIRKEISDIVHADKDKMERLGQIMNPSLHRRLKGAWTNDDLIVDMPLFFELQFVMPLDRTQEYVVFCVATAPETQRARIKARDGITDQKIDSILAKQMPQERKIAMSDVTIWNDGSLEDLVRKVLSYVEGYKT